eukprot:CAMPEP_0172779164 /NCGR_PEP_ID=MMETSP1074-20121228/202283_1 /TAXON_ID=2916 /ORGANISM="Ceratium fusus, Strain PA161109" /LENGTH=318 /DNA_ID=CAMNT_0013616119 /DNA_START=109 /DNA_END=1061 /DNA_ORIENTATION=-
MKKRGSRDNLGKGRIQPKDAKGVQGLADKLAEDLQESKLEGASIIVDRLEQLKDLALDGQVKQMRQLKEVMKNWREILNSASDKTDELATGDMSMCSCWYAPKVEVKLKDLFEEFRDIEKAFAKINPAKFQDLGRRMNKAMERIAPIVHGMKNLLEEFRDIEKAFAKINPAKFQDLGRRMNKAMERIAPIVHGMKNLPDEVSDIADRADEREETLKDTDTKPLKKKLESRDMTKSLSSLEDSKHGLLDLVELTQRNLEEVQTFVFEAHDKFKQAFKVPCPCCCMTSQAYDQPSRVLTELLENADTALDVDLQPFFELL